MACFRPLEAFRLSDGSVSFLERGDVVSRLDLPCGQCVGCRLARAEAWSLRLVHEAALYPDRSWFVTLTYSPENLPSSGSLEYRHFQLFMKRLRKAVKFPVRFFVCGEYGEQLQRPHYHACLFGLTLTDLKPFKTSGAGHTIFTSSFLSGIWKLGFVSVGELTKQSAGYVARYSLKKVTGAAGDAHYQRTDPSTGEIVFLQPEFARMSLKPGIGADWYRKYDRDVLTQDTVVHDGKRHRVPAYYDKLHRRADAAGLESVKDARSIKARVHFEDQTTERLAVREEVQRARIRSLKRSI